MAQFCCGTCLHTQLVDDIHLGKLVKCPHCKSPGRIHNGSLTEIASQLDQADALQNNLPPATVRRSSGGSIQTRLTERISLNKNSSLQRQWITIAEPMLPLTPIEDAKLTVAYREDSSQEVGGYFYQAEYQVKADVPVRAFQMRFLTFDVWGCHLGTLIANEVTDVQSGMIRTFKGKWRIHEESEAELYLTSLAYIAKVRTAVGEVTIADMGPVLDEIHRFNARLSEDDLKTPVR